MECIEIQQEVSTIYKKTVLDNNMECIEMIWKKSSTMLC